MTLTLERTALACNVSQGTLKDALTTVLRAVSDKRNIPIIGNVRLTVTESSLELATTDLEAAYMVRLPVLGGTPGAFTVPARLLADFVSSLPNAPVALRLDGGVLRVECGRAKAQMKGIPDDDFPMMPEPKGEPILLSRDTLREALTLTVFAVDKSGSRPVLSGVHLAHGERFICEAADGARMGRYAKDGEIDSLWDVIVPIDGARELLKLCEADQQEIPLWLLPTAENPSRLVAKVGTDDSSTVYAIRLLAGVYPDIARMVSQSSLTTVNVSRVALMAAVKQCTLFASADVKTFRLVKVGIGGQGELGLLTITAAEAQTGEGAAEVSVTVEGEETTVMLNGLFLTDCLTAMTGDSVVLGINGPTSPMTLRDPDVAAYVNVIMPMASVTKA